MKKKVIFLGGAYAQIPILEEAKKKGFYIITCDYLPSNPGHKLADEYYNISTTNKEEILSLAKRTKPDAIVAYASDPAAITSAYCSEILSLPGNPFKSVKTLSEKDIFRDFLNRNGFNGPKKISYSTGNVDTSDLNFPVIVKPTDSSGSKGVSKVLREEELERAIEYALNYSNNKRVIIEEFIEKKGPQLHGEGFVMNGELEFCCLGNHHYNEMINAFVPYSTTWPCKIDGKMIEKVKDEVSKAIKLSGFKNGPVNIEARINPNSEIFIMEIGPRNGGNYVPQVIQYSTKFNMVKAYLDILFKKPIKVPKYTIKPAAYYVIHSKTSGELIELSISDELNKYIKEYHQYIQLGEQVFSFQGANAAIGVLIMTFDTYDKMEFIINSMSQYINLKIGSYA